MKKIIASVIASIALILGMALPANAQSGYCWPSGASSYARLSVTAYYYTGIEYGTRYHIDMNSYGNTYASTVYFDGYNLNRYNDFWTSTGDHNYHTITGYWKQIIPYTEGNYKWVTCTVVVRGN